MTELEKDRICEKVFYSRKRCERCANLADKECRLDCYEGRGIDDCMNGIYRHLEDDKLWEKVAKVAKSFKLESEVEPFND